MEERILNYIDRMLNCVESMFDFFGEHLVICFIIALLIFSIMLMFFWEGKVRWWLRLPGINLVLFAFLLIAGTIEEIYLTFHPEKRTKWIKSSVFQQFFS